MWLLNVRGSDIPYSPLAFCHLWIPRESDQTGIIFIDVAKVSADVARYLAHIGLQMRPYSLVSSLSIPAATGAVVSDLALSLHIARSLEEAGHELVQAPSPVEREKAVKNEVELDGMRAAYRRDGRAWAEWAAWMAKTMKKRGAKMTEWEAAERLTARRRKLEYYVGVSLGSPLTSVAD